MEHLRRGEKVLELVQAALSLAPQDRSGFLRRASAGDVELIAEVESLLAAHQAADGFLSSPVWDAAPTLINQFATSSESHSLLNQCIGRYQIEALLGKGGMGEVFLASDLTLGRKVALKILPAKFMSDPQLVRRFEREAKAVSALNHPNILTIYEIGKTADLQFIATEFVAGETLRQGLKQEPMTLQAALEVALQIAAALLAAHESGIIHRDIKPENIMLRRDGQVKVLDFGLAKFTEKAVNVGDSATQTGIIMGTPGYMSPEQARALKMDGRTDIFSLGIVLYEMIAGRQPFEGATSIDVITAILHQDPAPLITHNVETPPALQRIVSKALQKDQAARYQSVIELMTDLQEVQRTLKTETGKRAQSTTETIEAETIRYQPEATDLIEVSPTILNDPVTQHPWKSLLVVGVAAGLLLGAAFAVPWLNRALRKAPPTPVVAAVEQKLYRQMTEAEREAFIGQKSQEISTLLGERPTPLNAEAVNAVKRWVDAYDKRVGNGRTNLWAEDLNFLFQRATQFAPTVVPSFKKYNVPPIVGLYLPLMETEYRNISSENFAGAAGLFQLLGPVVKEYGFNPSDRANVEKMAEVAAQYFADRMLEFGGDAKSMTLVLLSFNRGPDTIRRDLRLLRKENPNIERSFWSLMANQDKLDHFFQTEAINYVPRFYAAAIVGENPKVFGLTTQPLSTYTEPAK